MGGVDLLPVLQGRKVLDVLNERGNGGEMLNKLFNRIKRKLTE